jgi:hypothetical protein
MPGLAKRRPQRLWDDHKYPMHEIASGLPATCIRGRGADYTCKHSSFLIGLRRFARDEDVIIRAVPLFEDDDPDGIQIGFEVQFFWDRFRSRRDEVPDAFVYPDEDESELPRLSPYVREKYAVIRPELRAPVLLK